MRDSNIAILWRRIAAFFGRRQMEQDLADELAFHEEMTREALERQGNGHAASDARKVVGNSLVWRERARDAWGLGVLDEIVRDVRYSLRGLRRSPGFAVTAILTLALGIGADTVMFSVSDAAIFRPPPFEDPDSLYIVFGVRENTNNRGFIVPETYAALTSLPEITDVAASLSSRFDIGAEPYPEKLLGERVTSSFFVTLGVKPLVGRTFSAEEERRSDPVILISERLWESRYSANPDILGTSIPVSLNQVDEEGTKPSMTVIGVLPRMIQRAYVSQRDFWIPLEMDQEAVGRGLSVTARLKPGVTPEVAQTAMRVAVKGTEVSHFRENGEIIPATVTLASWSEQDTSTYAEQFAFIGWAMGLVLLIACAGVANLMLARDVERSKEFAVRAAIGAGRRRLFSQLMIESLTLSFCGAALGAVFAYFGTNLLQGELPAELARRGVEAADWRTFTFIAGVATLCSLAFGLLPAWKSSGTGGHEMLTREHGGGRSRMHWRGLLITGEIALALVLLVGGALMLQSYLRLVWKDIGFERVDLLTTEVSMPVETFQNSEKRTAMDREIERKLAAIPGIRTVGLADMRPLGFGLMNVMVLPEFGSESKGSSLAGVSDSYFEAMDYRLLEGRWFQPGDRGSNVAIISERLAREGWPGQSPVGQRVKLQGSGLKGELLEIVGVAGETVGMFLDRDATGEMYVPRSLNVSSSAANIVIRVEPGADRAALGPAIRKTLADIDPRLSVSGITSMRDVIRQRTEQPRFYTMAVTLFGSLGLLLTISSVVGVVGYLVRARTYEFGVRMALGATARDVMRSILKYGGKLAVVGIAIGLAGSFAAVRLIASMLYQVDPLDPWTLVLAPVVLLLCVLAACYVPARRTMRIDPGQALRSE